MVTRGRRTSSNQHSVPVKASQHKPPPLRDASNRAKAVAPAPGKKRGGGSGSGVTARGPTTAGATSQAAVADQLPGLDDEADSLVLAGAGCGQLPLPADGSQQTFFGNVFAKGGEAGGTLRVTSVTRGDSARRVSTVRLVTQPGEIEGKRMSRVAPELRPARKARTVPIVRDSRARPPASACSSSGSTSTYNCGSPAASLAACSSGGPAEGMWGTEEEEVECEGEEEACSSACSSLHAAAQQEASSDHGAVALIQAAVAGGRAAEEAACRVQQPPPLPVQPGAGPSSCKWQEAAPAFGQQWVPSPHEQQQCHMMPAALAYGSGSSGCEIEGTAAPAIPQAGAAPPPSVPQQQAFCPPGPFMHLHRESATAAWRSMWLHGLQYHNASRSGQPIRPGSTLHFIPLDPNDDLLSVLMFSSAVMPEHVISGAARFQDIVLASPDLAGEAIAAGVLSYGVWGVAEPDGSYRLLAEGEQIALPLSFRRAPPHTVALFLACVWHEANRAEAAGHRAYTFAANGERWADESCLKYAPEELLEWVRLALGCEQAAHESVAALAHIAEFGAE